MPTFNNTIYHLYRNIIKLHYHENNIKGINVKGQEVQQTYFADDGTFFINGSKESFEELVKT